MQLFEWMLGMRRFPFNFCMAMKWLAAVIVLTVTPGLCSEGAASADCGVVPLATRRGAQNPCRLRVDPAVLVDQEELVEELTRRYSDDASDAKWESRRTGGVTERGSPVLLHLLGNQASEVALETWRASLGSLRRATRLGAALTAKLDINRSLAGDLLAMLNISASPCPAKPSCDFSSPYRTVDGSCNNRVRPMLGMTNSAFVRLLRPDYGNGVHDPRRARDGSLLPNSRHLSAELFHDRDSPDVKRTLAVMQWGQLVAHDTSLSAVHLIDEDGTAITCCSDDGQLLEEDDDGLPFETSGVCYPIEINEDDPFYSQYNQRCFTLIRTLATMSAGCKLGAADKMNAVTHFLDLSMMYGADMDHSDDLRELSGGRMKTQSSEGGHDFPPNSDNPAANCDVRSGTDTCYVSGDFRVNQNYQLVAMSVVLLREHNRIADELSGLNPAWNDEQLYQETRKIMIAMFQHITYAHYLPNIVGSSLMTAYNLKPLTEGFSFEYDFTLNPSTVNSFNTAAFRAFHSTIAANTTMKDSTRCPVREVRFSDGYFKPAAVQQPGSLDSFLRGLTHQPSQDLDLDFTGEVTNHLFRTNKPFGLDLETFDIERGRDHGLPGYNRFRLLCNLPHAYNFEDFADVMSENDTLGLARLYTHPDDVDLFVGGMMERPVSGSQLGPTFNCLVGDQFYRWKFGDRFYYEFGGFQHSFSGAQLDEIRKSSLSRLVCDNGDNIRKIQPDSFQPVSGENPLVSCDGHDIPRVNLQAWNEDEYRR